NEIVKANQDTARTGEVREEAEPDLVLSKQKDNGDRGRGNLSRHRTSAQSRDHTDLPAHQLSHQRRQPIVLVLRPAVLDHHVLAFDVASLLQAANESSHVGRVRFRRWRAKKPGHGHSRLLRASCDRPSRRPAEKRNELPPPHSTTSSTNVQIISSRGGVEMIAATQRVHAAQDRDGSICPSSQALSNGERNSVT